MEKTLVSPELILNDAIPRKNWSWMKQFPGIIELKWSNSQEEAGTYRVAIGS